MSKSKRNPLKKNNNTKIRQEYIDYDYTENLDPAATEFLKKFTEEFYSGSFTKNKDKTKYVKNLHKTHKQRKERYNENNARNRDAMGITKIHNMLKDSEDLQAHMEDKSIRSACLSRRYAYNTYRFENFGRV